MMWGNMMSINMKSMGGEPKRHPEAPADGEEIMYVDLTRERLEGLYKDDNDLTRHMYNSNSFFG